MNKRIRLLLILFLLLSMNTTHMFGEDFFPALKQMIEAYNKIEATTDVNTIAQKLNEIACVLDESAAYLISKSNNDFSAEQFLDFESLQAALEELRELNNSFIIVISSPKLSSTKMKTLVWYIVSQRVRETTQLGLRTAVEKKQKLLISKTLEEIAYQIDQVSSWGNFTGIAQGEKVRSFLESLHCSIKRNVLTECSSALSLLKSKLASLIFAPTSLESKEQKIYLNSIEKRLEILSQYVRTI